MNRSKIIAICAIFCVVVFGSAYYVATSQHRAMVIAEREKTIATINEIADKKIKAAKETAEELESARRLAQIDLENAKQACDGTKKRMESLQEYVNTHRMTEQAGKASREIDQLLIKYEAQIAIKTREGIKVGNLTSEIADQEQREYDANRDREISIRRISP